MTHPVPAARAPQLVFIAVALLGAAQARAQTVAPAEPPANARVRFGPLAMNPSIALANFGIDDNVFNDPADQNPKQDLTATVTPRADLWLRLGPARVSGAVREDLVYFEKYVDQRYANGVYNGQVDVPFNRLMLTGGVAYATGRDRPGYEIDVRPIHHIATYSGLAALRVFSKTSVGVTAELIQTRFDATETFRAVNLAQQLNGDQTSVGVLIRHELTPLTTLTVTTDRVVDRFQLTPTRNADSTRVMFGVKLDPLALISGTASIGYRDFVPQSPGLADFRGLIANAAVGYIPTGSTKLTLELSRDVQYSYDPLQPYYIQTAATASVAQQIYGPVDVVARVGGARLNYRDVAGSAVTAADLQDRIASYGGGVGYRLGRDLRIGFNIDEQRRDSALPDRRYRGLRYGTSVTYGL